MDTFLSFRFEESKEDLLLPDPWLQVYNWVGNTKPDVQKINAGLNFLQFVDALGVSITI